MAEASRPGRLDDLDGEGRAPQASSSPSAGGAESDGHAAARRDESRNESRDESRARRGDEADSRGRYRSSLPGLSDDQAQGSSPSRRSSVSSVSSASSCNGSVAGGQPYDYYRAVRDFEGFVEDQAGIKEQFEADLVNIAKDVDPQPLAEGAPAGAHTNNSLAIARDAITGRGLPKIQPSLRPGTLTDSSEITDNGLTLYASLKSEARAEPGEPAPVIPDGASLQDVIMARQCTIGHEKGFFPIGCLESLIQEPVVVAELSRTIPPDSPDHAKIAEYAKQICPHPAKETWDRKRKKRNRLATARSYRKIFAILVIIEKTASITKFLAEGVHDGDLPLQKVDRGAGQLGGFELRRRNDNVRRLECFDSWSRMNVFYFEEWQWTVQAPFFSRGKEKDIKKYFLPDRTILPFTEDSRRQNRGGDDEEFEGGFSRVFKVAIHPDHHNFEDPKNGSKYFAIKSLNSQNIKAFQNEFEMLAKFSDEAQSHESHLITLLVAYKHYNVFYLVFPWADADLYRYWRSIDPTPAFSYETVLWVAEQCAGLAGGLLKIHQYQSFPLRRSASGHLDVPASHAVPAAKKLYGRHGDLKPANILWFKDADGRGTLKISDFGLAELNSLHSRSNLPVSRVGTSPSYRPPEYDMVDGKISRSYDIWTLGCLYLEFIGWMLGGFGYVKRFTLVRGCSNNLPGSEVRDSNFFEMEEGGKTARLKDTVTAFIAELHDHQSCSEYIHDFLNLIEYDMLLVETSGPQGNKKRIECLHLQQRLHDMHQKCAADQEYASKPASWKRAGGAASASPPAAAAAAVATGSRRTAQLRGQDFPDEERGRKRVRK